jgi:hypothetical protein
MGSKTGGGEGIPADQYKQRGCKIPAKLKTKALTTKDTKEHEDEAVDPKARGVPEIAKLPKSPELPKLKN